MEGYLKSKNVTWIHAFKQSVRPGGKIELDYLYNIYGTKYGLKEGEEFLDWLKDVKLKNSKNKWEIILQNDTTPDELTKEAGAIEVSENGTGVVATQEEYSEPALKDFRVEDIVMLSVRKAREIIPQITDVKLLKYALQEARQRPNKDSLVRILDKRVQMIGVAGRY